MNKHPVISVVLPTHNGGRFLDQSIQSVVDQTWQDWELILVDDASTDGTTEKVRSWAGRDPRIRAIFLERNRKLPGALNAGFSQACGEFHTWTSDDNWYHPQALERMLAAIQSDPSLGVVYTQCTWVDEGGSILRRPTGIGPPRSVAVTCSVGACFLYRKEVFETVGGCDENFFLAEDYDFWLRASNFFLMKYLEEENLYYYRDNPGSLSRTKTEGVMRSTEAALQRWLPNCPWLTPEERVAAYVRWGCNSFHVGGWHRDFDDWIRRSDPHLDEEMQQEIFRRMVPAVVDCAWSMYWTRQWERLESCCRFVLRNAPDVEAARLPFRKYPRWCYAVRDRLGAFGSATGARLRRLSLPAGSTRETG